MTRTRKISGGSLPFLLPSVTNHSGDMRSPLYKEGRLSPEMVGDGRPSTAAREARYLSCPLMARAYTNNILKCHVSFFGPTVGPIIEIAMS